MWTCPRCERNFKSSNQSHMCTTKTVEDIFSGKPENLILAFDEILINVIDWDPCSVGMSTNTVVFTKEKAWLIIKPLAKELDVKFYYDSKIDHPLIFKTTSYRNTFAHHIRISSEEEVSSDLIRLLRIGYDFK